MKIISITFLFSLMIMQVLGGRSFLFKKQNVSIGNSTVTSPPSNVPSLATQLVNNGNDTLFSINTTNSARMNSIQPIVQVPVENIAQMPLTSSPIVSMPVTTQPTVVAEVDNSNIAQIPNIVQPTIAMPITPQPLDTSNVLQIPTHAQSTMMPVVSQPTPTSGNIVQVPLTSVDVAQVPLNSENIAQVPIDSASIAQIPVDTLTVTQVPINSANIAQIPVDTSTVTQVPINSANIAQIPVDTSTVTQVPINSASIAQIPVDTLTVTQVPINSASIAQVPLSSNLVTQTPVIDTSSLNLDKITGLINPTTTTQIKVAQIPQNAFNWAQTPMMANDVGVSAEGDIYVAGLDGKLYTYNFATASYTRVIADPDLDNITRVSVDGNGTPYVITSCGASYYLSCDNKWIQLPGCASDIGAGSCGQIWKTGCDQRQDGFGIWKLFCSGEEKKCKRYRQLNSYSTCNQLHAKRECYWYRVSGSGVRIDVFPDGKPATVQSNGAAIKYDGNEWKMITQFPASDITVSNENMVIISGTKSGLYFIPTKPTQTRDDFIDERYSFSLFAPESAMQKTIEEPLDARTRYIDVGCTMSLSSGPYSQPTIIPCITQYQPIVALTQKFNYN